MEPTQKFNYKAKQLEKAYKRFEDAVSQERNEFVQDSVIQRYEFTFELFWKVGKFYLEIQWIQVNSPRAVMKSLYEIGVIDDVDLFLDMMEVRNLSSHIYDEEKSNEIYDFITKNYQHLYNAYKNMEI